MQNIIVEKPYRFVPPHRGDWWPSFIQQFNLYSGYVRRTDGVTDFECRHTERLKASLQAGHGVLLTPNHCRVSDPLVMGFLAREVGTHVYAMASWHLFNQTRFMAWAIRLMGGFSVYREGVDRQAIDTAISVLEEARRPLIVFPEGATSKTNDRLNALLDGVAFIARVAAKKRAKLTPHGRVVVHPVAIKYVYSGNLQKSADEVLSEIETRLSWHPQRDLGLLPRIAKVGRAPLTLKEIEYFSSPQSGSLQERIDRLIDRLLQPLESEWFGQTQNSGVVNRVKNLRMKILPEMVNGQVTSEERQRRWRQLADIYLAQQASSYPPDYLDTRPSAERIVETLERFEEDLTDRSRVHGELKAIIEVDEAIEVSPERDRSAKSDPLMAQIEQRIQAMLDRLMLESPVYSESAE